MRIRLLVSTALASALALAGVAHAQTRVTSPSYIISKTPSPPAANEAQSIPPQTGEAPQPDQKQQKKSEAARSAAQNGHTPTAAQQGYNPGVNAAQMAAAKKAYDEAHTPRQLGEVVHQPAPLNPVASQAHLSGWLSNWSYTLERAGVPKSKVDFEAQRLDQHAFATWAHRQLMFIKRFPNQY